MNPPYDILHAHDAVVLIGKQTAIFSNYPEAFYNFLRQAKDMNLPIVGMKGKEGSIPPKRGNISFIERSNSLESIATALSHALS